MKSYVVFLAFVTIVKGAQDIQPYSFDRYPSWNQGNIKRTNWSYYYPSVERQFLQLFGDGALAAFLFSAVGALVNVALTTFGLANTNQRIDSTNQQVDSLQDPVALNTARSKATCKAVQNLLSLTNPIYDDTAVTQSTSPSPSPVSGAINSAPGFTVFPITNGGAYIPDPLFDQGLEIDNPPANIPLGQSPDQAALSIADFNVFRIQVMIMIDILDQKIRDMLNVQAPQCP